MRRKKARKAGRTVPILIAAGAGYLIGSWNAAALRGNEPLHSPTAAQTVALRFPPALSEAPVLQAAYEPAAASDAAALLRRAQLALFDPEPMLAARSAAASMPVQTTAPDAERPPASQQTADLAPLPPPQGPAATAGPVLPKPHDEAPAALLHSVSPRRQAKRPGYMLDDAQIADIKRRLHLTPDQEQMWPAVAAALRNIGYQREREARARGTAPAINPDSPEVADLKSAAFPLLMSFSDEQKNEVRDLAHHMGLDHLASEF